MSATVTLHEITGSPNSTKVRIALGLKGIAYERRPVELSGGFPGDRGELVRLSTQPRAPVLVHGETVVFDSSAILRYLEANFPATPRLFTTDWAQMREIEEWETWARTELSRPVSAVFQQALAEEPDEAACRAASDLMHELTGRIESALAENPYLLRDTASAADVTAAPTVHLALLPEELARSGPVFGFFHRNLTLGEGRERTKEWVGSLMAHDAAWSA